MGAASRGLRENDDRRQEKILDPGVAEASRCRASVALRHSLLTALVATATFVLLT